MALSLNGGPMTRPEYEASYRLFENMHKILYIRSGKGRRYKLKMAERPLVLHFSLYCFARTFRVSPVSVLMSTLGLAKIQKHDEVP